MKTKHLPLFFLLTGSLSGFAQNPYTAADFITSGNFLTYQKTNYITEPQPITNFTTNNWDYMYPESFEYDTTFAKSISEIGLEDSFPEADLCIQESDVYMILKHNNNKLWLLGLAATVNENFIPVVLPDPIDVMHFPITVGTNISRQQSVPATFTPAQLGLSAADLGVPVEPDSIRITFQITIASNISAYGIFGGQAGAYLENNTQTVGYTVKVLYWGIWWPVNSLANSRTVRTMNYWMPGFGLPVCKVNLNAENEVIEFRIEPQMIVSLPVAKNTNSLVYPNPAEHFIMVENSDNKSLQIVTITGKIVLESIIHSSFAQINISHLPTGVYFLNTNGRMTKFIKR
jgi:hypothetical protein